MNVGQSIEQVVARLESTDLYYGHGTDNVVDEAAWLVLHSIDASLDGSFEQWDMPVDEQQARLIARRVEERIQTGNPLAYILGSAWFAGLEFDVNHSVLVPRSPIAELIPARAVARLLGLPDGDVKTAFESFANAMVARGA